MNRIVKMVLKNFFRLPGAWFKLCRYAKHPEKYPEAERYAHIRYMLDLAIGAGNIHVDVRGLENIPTQGGFMMYANHQGLFDVLAIASTCEIPIGSVLKKELYKVPFIHQVCLCTKSFSMDREDVRQSLTVINAVIDEVKAGRNYLIFPEGTRSKLGNRLLPFHGGSFRCATKAKCPIVPIALIDSYRVLDEKGSKPVSMQLHYLPVIPYEEYATLKPAELAELVRGRIAQVVESE